MLLIGKIDFKNTDQQDGYLGPYTLKFLLPRRLSNKAHLKLKYFGWFQGIYDEDNDVFSVDLNFTSTYNRYGWRYTPDAMKVSFSSHGEDLMGDNVAIEFVRTGTDKTDVEFNNSNALLFTRSVGAMARALVGGVTVPNMNDAFDRGLWAISGHNALHDLEICKLERNISEIEVKIEFIRDKFELFHAAGNFSGEELMRLSDLTIVLELIE